MSPPSDGWGTNLGDGNDGWGSKPVKPKKVGCSWASGITKPAAPKALLNPTTTPKVEAPKLEAAPIDSGASLGSKKAAPPITSDASRGGNTGGDDSGAAAEAGDDVCRYCKKPGHFARECPEKPANDGGCFNCGEQGHNKSECPNPKKPFDGECRSCGQQGHSSRECPDASCRKCQQKGHNAKECTNGQKPDFSFVQVRASEDAWNDMVKASAEDDIDAFKVHMLEYMRATPETNLAIMESAFRGSGEIKFYILALSCEDFSYSKIIVGPHGETDFKYLWSISRSAKPRRSKALSKRLASTPEENMEWLNKAGFLEDYQGDYCRRCKTKDHSFITCEADTETEGGLMGDMKERPMIKCTNCESLSHRLRDCPEPRRKEYNPNVCRNCQEEGHKAADCENPRVAGSDTECRVCEGKGHFGSDCPNASKRVCFNCGQDGHRSSDCQNEKVPKCRNCDEFGHIGKDCPKPRDMTRVKCSNCEELGHFPSKCPKPKKEGTDTNGNDSGGGAARDSGGGDDVAPVEEAPAPKKPAAKKGKWSAKPAAPSPAEESPWGTSASGGDAWGAGGGW